MLPLTCIFGMFHPGGSFCYAKCSGRILMHFAIFCQEAVYAYSLKALLFQNFSDLFRWWLIEDTKKIKMHIHWHTNTHQNRKSNARVPSTEIQIINRDNLKRQVRDMGSVWFCVVRSFVRFSFHAFFQCKIFGNFSWCAMTPASMKPLKLLKALGGNFWCVNDWIPNVEWRVGCANTYSSQYFWILVLQWDTH